MSPDYFDYRFPLISSNMHYDTLAALLLTAGVNPGIKFPFGPLTDIGWDVYRFKKVVSVKKYIG